MALGVTSTILLFVVLTTGIYVPIANAAPFMPSHELGEASKDPHTWRCLLDPKINETTWGSYHDEINGIWGWACGINRGVFVTTPGDGHTYNCGKLPSQWGVSNVAEILTAPPAVGIKALGLYIESVYNSSAVRSICDFNGLAVLSCGREEPWRVAPWAAKLDNQPIRGVNIGGLFVLEAWILQGFVPGGWGNVTGIYDQYTFSKLCGQISGLCDALKQHWASWYTAADFTAMKAANLNTIRLPVGWWYFAPAAGVDPSPYLLPDQDLLDPNHPITSVIQMAKAAGLQVILDLHGAPKSQNGFDNSGRENLNPDNWRWGEGWLFNATSVADTVSVLSAMGKYVKHLSGLGADNVIAIELLNEPWIDLPLGPIAEFYRAGMDATRASVGQADFPILIHDAFRDDQWGVALKDWGYTNVFMDKHLYHGFNIADIASDSPQDDKTKQVTHEIIACGYGELTRRCTCAALPVFMGEFSLAIDDCMKGASGAGAPDRDYGQCNNVALRKGDDWWRRHIRSFAMRQISRWERELGWTFWTWKLDDVSEAEPAAYEWSMQAGLAQGLFDTDNWGGHDYCEHQPSPN